MFTEYVNSEALITILCPTHGSYLQSCYLHSKGHKCRKCSTEETVRKNYDKNRSEFLSNIKNKFKGNTDITGNYVNNGTKIKYKCASCLIEYENIPNKVLAKNNVG